MSPDRDARDGPASNDEAFALSIVEDGQHLLVTARGDIDVESVTAFHDGLHTAVSRAPLGLEIDLGQVTFLGSEGIRTLVLLHESAAAQGTRVTVSDASPIVRRVLKLTESDWLLDD